VLADLLRLAAKAGCLQDDVSFAIPALWPGIGKLAATLGLIAASSAPGIVRAFLSPDAASRISAIEFFNLLGGDRRSGRSGTAWAGER
jgi:hypothetical protein